MFCSKCGRTLKPEWKKCENCGMPVGESRFEGMPYTSAQTRIVPGEAASVDMRAYTRMTYTGGDYAETDEGDVDVRTTYRPVYETARAPVMNRRAEEAPAEEEPEEEIEPSTIDAETLERNIEGFQISDIKSRPIVSSGRAGISPDVDELVKKLNNASYEPERRQRRGRHVAANDTYVPEDEEKPVSEAPVDGDYIEDEEPAAFDRGKLIKIIVGLAVVAALFVVGVYVIPGIIKGFRSAASAPIEGVSNELYDSGTALLDAHIQQDYIDGVMAIYESGGYIALVTRLDSDKQEIAAMLPATPGTNDQLFITAVTAVQDDIGSAIILDANEIANGGTGDSAESQARWASINETVTGFKAIRSAADLQNVINGERIEPTYSVETPAPLSTPAPEYTTLAKGDESDSVKKMQERLWELGYLDDTRDGVFGGNTQTAVKLFQQTNGLEVTGIADNAMQVLLYSEEAIYTSNAKITPAPDPTEEPTAEPTTEPSTEPTDGGTQI